MHVTIEQMVDRLAYLKENLPKGEGYQAVSAPTLRASAKPLPPLSADAPVPSHRNSFIPVEGPFASGPRVGRLDGRVLGGPFGDLNGEVSQRDRRTREVHEPAAGLATSRRKIRVCGIVIS
jgi:hypothetical protein